MKLAVFYDHVLRAAEQMGVSIEQALQTVRGMGYTMLEADLDHFDADPALMEKLRAAGFGIANICCFLHFERDDEYARGQRLIDTALRGGAERIMPIPGLFSAENDAAELDRMTASMASLVERAQKAGLDITIEDYDNARSPIHSTRGMLHFLSDQPALGVSFDTGNFRFAAEDVLDAFEKLKDRIRHVHVKDRALKNMAGESNKLALDGTKLYPCAVGEGVLPLETVFNRLKGLQYNRVLTVEHFDGDDQMRLMAQSAAYMQQHFSFDK